VLLLLLLLLRLLPSFSALLVLCSAASIARIEAVLEDARGCCHVALRYFWRWGQIHAGADLQPALRPRWGAACRTLLAAARHVSEDCLMQGALVVTAAAVAESR
jgi:hypothetical protein